MPANKKPSGVPKNAVRCALITAATVATLMGAQTLAFSQNLKDILDQQAAVTLASTQESTQQAIVVATSDGQTAALITPVPSQTPSATATATTPIVAPKLATQVSASPRKIAASRTAGTMPMNTGGTRSMTSARLTGRTAR